MNKIITFLSVVFIISCPIVFTSQAYTILPENQNEDAPQYPVRWSDKVKVKGLREVEALLDKPVDLSGAGDGTNELVLTSDTNADDKVKVRTVREYQDHRIKGYSPATTYDISMASWFVFDSNNLQFLKTAIPSKISYLLDFILSKENLKYIPVSLIASFSEDDELKGADTLGEISGKLLVKATDRNSIDLQYERATSSITFLAWGDFDHDGIEDVLTRISYYSDGSGINYQSAIITRKEKSGKLIVLCYLD